MLFKNTFEILKENLFSKTMCLVFFINCFSFCKLTAQTITPIQLDRPDQTECPFITPKKYIQIENGFNVEKYANNKSNYILPTTLWKYGINEKFELRIITEVITEKINFKNRTAITPITIGFKTSLFEEKGFLPKTSFIGHITTSSIGSKYYHTENIAPSFRFVMQHTLSKKVVLAYNIGAEWNGENANQNYIYTLTTGISLTDKVGCYAELYGFLSKYDKADHRFDGGFTYLINNDFIIDLSSGLSFTKSDFRNYLSFGLSYRFKII